MLGPPPGPTDSLFFVFALAVDTLWTLCGHAVHSYGHAMDKWLGGDLIIPRGKLSWD